MTSARLWLLLGLAFSLAAFAAAAAVALTHALGERWEAEVTISFASLSADPLLFGNQNASLTERELSDAAALAASEAVLEPAARRLAQGVTWTDVQDAVTVTPQPGSNILTIAVMAPDSVGAAARVDAVVTAFSDEVRARQVEQATATARAAVQAARAATGNQVDALNDIAARAQVVALTADPVSVLTTGAPVQTRPAPVRDAATGAVLGLLAAAGILVFVRLRPTKVATSQDAGELLGLPAGELQAGALSSASAGLAEDLRRLAHRSPGRRLVVVPAGPASVRAAQEVAAVLRLEDARGAPDMGTGAVGNHVARTTAVGVQDRVRVRVTRDPATSVVAPLARNAGAVVLAVEAGAPVREMRAAGRLSGQWEHPPDAVFVAT